MDTSPRGNVNEMKMEPDCRLSVNWKKYFNHPGSFFNQFVHLVKSKFPG